MKKKFGRASSVGVIGGATAVFVVSKKKMEKRRIEQEAFLDRAQKLARPCAKSFSETVTYLREVYGAQPCELSKGQWQSAKVNIILNLHPELVDRQERERQSRPPVRKKRLARLVESWAGWWRGGQPEPVEEIDPLTVVLERTHEYMALDGKGGGALSDDLTRYRGISEKDIREKSPRFLGYAYLMKQDGIWK